MLQAWEWARLRQVGMMHACCMSDKQDTLVDMNCRHLGTASVQELYNLDVLHSSYRMSGVSIIRVEIITIMDLWVAASGFVLQRQQEIPRTHLVITQLSTDPPDLHDPPREESDE